MLSPQRSWPPHPPAPERRTSTSASSGSVKYFRPLWFRGERPRASVGRFGCPLTLKSPCFEGPTCPAEQHGGVGGTQHAVVTEALQHGGVHMEAAGQELGGDGRPTDEPGQALTHGQRLSQLPWRQETAFRRTNILTLVMRLEVKHSLESVGGWI